jgi:GT2 family glycosyltransferase
VYNTPAPILKACIESVLLQTSPVWELILCDDASSDRETLKVLHHYQGLDSRIKIIRNEKNLHIAEASNRAVSFATGDFVGFLDHDDTLASEAVFEVEQAIKNLQDVDLIYSDEDKIDFDGSYCDPYFKPIYSPEHLLSVMYILHFLVVRKSMFLAVGGFREEFSGAQDYDLALRVTSKSSRVHRIPKVLYHWRKIDGSAAATVDAKPYALQAGKRALADLMKDRKATVLDGLLPGCWRVRYPLPESASVTLLILSGGAKKEISNKGEIVLVENALASIKRLSSYRNYRLLVVHGNDLSEETLRLIADLGGRAVADDRINEDFNYSQRLNFGFQNVQTEYVIVLNDDIEICQNDWIESLLEWLVDEEVGVVGARLLYPDGLLQHAGIALVPGCGATHPFYRMSKDTIGYNGYTHIVRNVAAVTGAVMATKLSLVHAVGGFDEQLSTDFNDVDFCLKVISLGQRIVWTPFCELIHYEGSSLKRTSQNPFEVELFQSRWQQLTAADPYIDLHRIKAVMRESVDPNNTVPDVCNMVANV